MVETEVSATAHASGRVRLHEVKDVTIKFLGVPRRLHSLMGGGNRLSDDEPRREVSLPGLWTPLTPFRDNLLVYDWASVIAHLMSDGTADYRVNGMYVEFKNVSDPSAAIAAPAYDRSGAAGYYADLANSPDADFLRVPLIAASTDNSDPTKFSANNRVTFFAMTQGAAGVHGKPFNDSVNSKVYGLALVAMPSQGDRSRDVVFSRTYFDADEQQVKTATSQVGVQWPMAFK